MKDKLQIAERFKWKKRHLGSLIFASTLLLGGISPLATSASENYSEPYLWDEETKEVIDFSTIEIEKIPNEKYFSNPIENKLEKIDGEIGPLWEIKQFVRYDPSTPSINYTYKYVDRVIGDNRANLYTDLEIWFETEKNGSFTLEGSISYTGTIEKNAIVAKVDHAVSIGATASRTWSSGTKYGAKTVVPPKVRGAVTGYIPGISTKGQLVYKITTDSTGEVRYQYEAVGGYVPAKSMWNIVPQIPYNG